MFRFATVLLGVTLVFSACGGEGGTGNAADGSGPTGDTTNPGGDAVVSPVSCDSDADCTGQGMVCDPLLNECVACLFDTDCEANQHCVDYVCDPYTPCTNSLDCVDTPQGPICDEATSECAACQSDADCVDGAAHCIAGECLPFTTCASSLDCVDADGKPICDATTGECVACVTDSDCGENQHCEGATCLDFVSCDSDVQCTSLGMLCNKDISECQQCLEHAHCPAEYNCQGGSCVLDATATTPPADVVECGSAPDAEAAPGERCLAESDLALMEDFEFEDFEGKLANCAFGCFMVKECMTNCIAQVLYFTCPCATCFADMMVCISVLCFDPCPGEGCHACMAENGCYDDFEACSGVSQSRPRDEF